MQHRRHWRHHIINGKHIMVKGIRYPINEIESRDLIRNDFAVRMSQGCSSKRRPRRWVHPSVTVFKAGLVPREPSYGHGPTVIQLLIFHWLKRIIVDTLGYVCFLVLCRSSSRTSTSPSAFSRLAVPLSPQGSQSPRRSAIR